MLTEKKCSKCGHILPAARFNKARWLASGLRPDCKDCYAASKRAAWASKPKSETAIRRAENAALLLEGLRRCKACGEVKAADAGNYSTVGTGTFNSTCRVCDRRKTRAWTRDNEERYKANAAAGWAFRHASKKQRSVSLTPEHRRQIRAIYAECRRRNAGTPRAWHVDHIMPLHGRNSCGLHVPWNLQILLGRENVRKSNKAPTENYSLDAATAGARSLLSMIALSGKT